MVQQILLFICLLELIFLLFLIIHFRKYKTVLKEEYRNKFSFIEEITRPLRILTDFDKVLIEILNILSKKTNQKNSFIYLLEEDKENYYLKCIGCPHIVSISGISKYSIVVKKEESLILNNIIKNKNIANNIIISELEKILPYKNFLVIPMVLKNKVIGFILTQAVEENTQQDFSIFSVFANEAALAIENAKLYEKLESMSTTDGLTGVYNRRYLEQQLPKEIELAKRYKSFLSICIIDIDDFKHYNDKNGHLAGDDCLKKVAEVISSTIRSGDIVARYGGEEFLVILPATDKNGAFIAAEKIRKNIEQTKFENASNQPLGKVTVSIGVATYPTDAQDYIKLIEAADQFLYKAKTSGKNKVCC
jgi:diguanylate cyclase (GGDEF)-like protein